MNQIILFDYEALDAETRIVVQQRTSEIRTLVRRSAQDIIEIGQKLIEVKERLGYGGFGPWLELEFQWTPQVARQLIHVAENFFGVENEIMFRFGTSALRLLSAPSTPKPARVEALERAGTGEAITHKTARAIVEEYKPTPVEESPRLAFASSEPKPYSPNTLLPNGHSPTFTAARVVVDKPSVLRLAAANHIISDDPEYDGDEWYTPAEFIEAARVLMGAIDLDPASCSEAQKTVKATRYFTKANNGLIQTWRGRVWMNPPYSTPLIGKFVQKAIAEAESEHIHQAVILVNNSTDTEWFQSLTCRFPVMFSRGRAKFWRANAGVFGARQGQALFYVGLQVQRFYECFEQIAYVPIGVAHDYS